MSLLLYTDVSLKGEIMSLGWVLYRVTDTLERSFLEVGSRVINIDEDDREWNGSTEGEFRALISGVRAATDYDDDVILCCVDCNSTAYKANNRLKLADDGYFNHALHSFLGRFDDWRIKEINREDNTLAHDMATISRRAIEREGAIL